MNVFAVNISAMTPEVYEKLYAAADDDRRRRADRYLRREDSLRCITADALLRYAVKRITGMDAFCVECAPGGKPFIRETEHFHYNLSHSGDWVVIACADSEVGADVERIRMDSRKESIARRFFTPQEQAYIFENEALASQRFFRVWTGKESYLKYLGTGLRGGMDTFSVLSPALSAMLHSRMLEGGYILTVCTTEENMTFEQLRPEALTQV